MTNEEVLKIIEEAKRDGRKKLDLSDKGLTSLPPEIGQLTSLQTLNLEDNQLSALPKEIGKLTSLESLNLRKNELSALPKEIGQLTNLTKLELSGTKLTSLPKEIGQLTNLTRLGLAYNKLKSLPAEIRQLRKLKSLDLVENQLKSLPPEIGQLISLASVWLRNNQLITLPAEFGNLSNVSMLALHDNPWSEPFAELVAGPKEELFAYLRSLQEGVPQYEAKVLLVGEGAVGKSSLLAALNNEKFVKDRETTHGIEIKQVEAEHPDEAVKDRLKLNFWDFGGQEVYRITHQFFFSRHALYLLVWKPREGQEENAIKGWLERIRLRVGDAAQVLIVATHCNERHPELDYPALERQYGDILAGHCAVDSADDTGIPEIRTRIAAIAASLEHVGTAFNQSWLDARDELLDREETHVTYDTFEEVCKKHKLDETDARTLLGMLHTLGHVVYYDTDGLRDFVVLRPEWLTKAIGYVLEDKTTRTADGILDHRRLQEIWCDHGDAKRERYDPKYFPFFLRLMEQYDVSDRLEGQHASLVAQMVPYERPSLPWEVSSPTDDGQMSLVCEMEQSPPGLVAWTTVRNHLWTTGTHWRSGVFLAHEDGHGALIDLTNPRQLQITVRGEYPSHFMALLRAGLERLIKDRWPHLAYKLFVPCPTIHDDGTRCEGQFPMRTLIRALPKGRLTLPCQECLEDVSVNQLLLGYAIPVTPLDKQLEALLAKLEAMEAKFDEASQERQRYAAQTGEMTRRVLHALLDEARQGPRLFSLARMAEGSWKPSKIGKETYRLTLWCEHPGHEHRCGKKGQYEITQPKEWLKNVAPYVSLITKVLRVAVPMAAGAAGLVAEELEKQLNFMEKLTDALLPDIETPPEHRLKDEGRAISHVEGAGLREFHALLKDIDKKQTWGGLRRVTAKASGDVLWVCPKHYKIYDPGLPKLPKQKGASGH